MKSLRAYCGDHRRSCVKSRQALRTDRKCPHLRQLTVERLENRRLLSVSVQAFYANPTDGRVEQGEDNTEAIAEVSYGTAGPPVGNGAALASGSVLPDGLAASVSLAIQDPDGLNMVGAIVNASSNEPQTFNGPVNLCGSLGLSGSSEIIDPGDVMSLLTVTAAVKFGDNVIWERTWSNGVIEGGETFEWTVPEGQQVSLVHTLLINSQLRSTSTPFSSAVANVTSTLDVVCDDVIPTRLEWNTDPAGAKFHYEVTGSDLTEDTTAALYWASGETFDTVIGDPVYETTIERTVGEYGPFSATSEEDLGNLPPSATHLLLVTDPDNLIAETDETNNVAFIALFGGDHQLFEKLARDVVYEGGWTIDDPILSDGEPLPYTVSRVFGGADGFYALGLESGLYGPALVIRGTDPTADWFTDLLADSDRHGVGYGQFFAHRGNVYNWLNDVGRPADVVGHSLGGALAQWIAADYTSDGELIDELVTFNSPGISNTAAVYGNLVAYASDYVPDNRQGVTHYISSGDFASLAGEAFVAGQVKMASFSELNIVDKHLLPLLIAQYRDKDNNLHQQPVLAWQFFGSADLSEPSFSYADQDYNLWLVGLEVSLHSSSLTRSQLIAELLSVPAMLMRRDKVENARLKIGRYVQEGKDALHVAANSFQWAEMTPGRFGLTVGVGAGELAHDLYEVMRITVQNGFNLTVDTGNPPMLRLDGGLSINLGENVAIDLPAWLGGPITADYLIDLVDMDVSGVIDRHHWAVDGQLAVLGGLLTVDGSAELDWDQSELTLSGALDFLDGFITANSAIRVGSGLDLVMSGTGAVSIPDAVPWIGGTEIASGSFMLDFIADLNMGNDFLAAWGSIGPLELGLRQWFDGRWDILGARKIDSLQQAGVAAAEAAFAMQAPYGESFPIAPGTDWVLFAAEWENSSTTAALTLETPSGQVLTEADIQTDPSMTIVAELTGDRRKVVRVDAPDAGIWIVSLTDTAGLGVVDVAAFVHDSAPSVDVTSVSDGLLREPVQIGIEAFDPDSDATVSLFYDTDNQGFDGVMFANGIGETDGPAQYDWDTIGVAAGEYYVYAMAIDESNPPVLAYAATPMQITDFASIAGRHVFYNNSSFDGDAAIAPYKEALLPGDVATLVNYTSYNRGINGIMVDLAGLPDAVVPTADDFEFHVGNDNAPAGWTKLDVGPTVTLREDAGEYGSHRVTITWPDDTIRNTWVQMTVLAENLGLPANDVFYFGNAVAEAGNSTDDAKVTTTDLLLARNNPRGFLEAAIDFPYDFDRDGEVNATDVLLARNNQTSFFNALNLIDLTGVAEEAQQPPLANLAWLTDLDQAATQRPEQKDSAEDAVDLLLATLWS